MTNSGVSSSFCFSLVHGTLILTKPSFHPLPALRVGPDLEKCSWSKRLVAVTALKSWSSDESNSGCIMTLWTSLFIPAGVFPEPRVIQVRRRSSDQLCELVRGSCSPAGATAVKPDPIDWGWEVAVVVGTSAKASGSHGLWEEMVKYFRNTPNELAFVMMFSDPIWSPTRLSSGLGSLRGGGCVTTSFALKGALDCFSRVAYCLLRCVGTTNVGR